MTRTYTAPVTAEALRISEAAIRDYRRRKLIPFQGRGYTAGQAVAIAAVNRIGPGYLGEEWGPVVTRDIADRVDSDDYDPKAPLVLFVAVQADRENVAGLIFGDTFTCFGDAPGPFVLLDLRPVAADVIQALKEIAGSDDWRRDAAIGWIRTKLENLERLRREGSLRPDTYERGRVQLAARLKTVDPTMALNELPVFDPASEPVHQWPDNVTPDWLAPEDPRLSAIRVHLRLLDQPVIREALGDLYERKRAELAHDLKEISDDLTLEGLEAERDATE